MTLVQAKNNRTGCYSFESFPERNHPSLMQFVESIDGVDDLHHWVSVVVRGGIDLFLLVI